MAFDVFEKISELETKVYLLETELQEKTDLIQTLRERNDYLEVQLSNTNKNETRVNSCEKPMAEVLREASEGAMKCTGYVFDDRTGLYYDNNSGYYYDPDNRTFYEPRSGIYYKYDPETAQYTRQERTELILKDKTPCETLTDDCRASRKQEKAMLPAGSDENVTTGVAEIKSGKSRKTAGSHLTSTERHEISAGAVLYPPTLRLVVLSADSAPDGTVYLLSSKECSEGWGCIGSSSAFCTSVNFPLDNGVAPIHCEVIYRSNDRIFSILTRDSPRGTHLNGEKLSQLKSEKSFHDTCCFVHDRIGVAPGAFPTQGETRPLRHADILRLASVRLLLHVHEGKDDCKQCDGSLQKPVTGEGKLEAVDDGDDDADGENGKICIAGDRLEKERRATLMRMKNKYGLKPSLQSVASKIKTQYVDRAARRRAMEKDSQISIDGIPETVDYLPVRRIVSNRQHEKSYGRGAKMLCKMGWKPGQGLGKLNTGMLEPVKVKKRSNNFAGLGSEDNGPSNHDVRWSNRQRSRCLEITRERYRSSK